MNQRDATVVIVIGAVILSVAVLTVAQPNAAEAPNSAVNETNDTDNPTNITEIPDNPVNTTPTTGNGTVWVPEDGSCELKETSVQDDELGTISILYHPTFDTREACQQHLNDDNRTNSSNSTYLRAEATYFQNGTVDFVEVRRTGSSHDPLDDGDMPFRLELQDTQRQVLANTTVYPDIQESPAYDPHASARTYLPDIAEATYVVAYHNGVEQDRIRINNSCLDGSWGRGCTNPEGPGTMTGWMGNADNCEQVVHPIDVAPDPIFATEQACLDYWNNRSTGNETWTINTDKTCVTTDAPEDHPDSLVFDSRSECEDYLDDPGVVIHWIPSGTDACERIVIPANRTESTASGDAEHAILPHYATEEDCLNQTDPVGPNPGYRLLWFVEDGECVQKNVSGVYDTLPPFQSRDRCKAYVNDTYNPDPTPNPAPDPDPDPHPTPNPDPTSHPYPDPNTGSNPDGSNGGTENHTLWVPWGATCKQVVLSADVSVDPSYPSQDACEATLGSGDNTRSDETKTVWVPGQDGCLQGQVPVDIAVEPSFSSEQECKEYISRGDSSSHPDRRRASGGDRVTVWAVQDGTCVQGTAPRDQVPDPSFETEKQCQQYLQTQGSGNTGPSLTGGIIEDEEGFIAAVLSILADMVAILKTVVTAVLS